MHINLNAMGTRMKRRRKELKMSQAELAEKVNVSNNHISSIETGKQIPSLTTFVKICEQLDTTPDFLLLGSLHTDNLCSRSKFLSKLLKTFDKTFREIFPVFISTKRREKPSAFFDNNFVNNAYFSEAASSSSSHLASSSSKAPISSRMTCLCLWSS